MPFLKVNPATRISFFAFIFISITFLFVKFRQVNSDPAFIRDSYALSWDNYGYYLHLPATFIYHDIGIENKSWLDSLNKNYQPQRPFYQCWEGQKNRLVNVYPVGLAICNVPFFLGGHVAAKIFGYKADGLSPPYQWAMIFSSLFYAILGMWLLRKLLLKFFNDKLSALLLFLIAFATNLYYYATYDDILPHIFLFAIDTQLILFTISWHEKPNRKTALSIGLLLGLSTIVRPSEIVWALIPVFWNVSGWKSFLEKIKMFGRNFSHVIILIAGMCVIGSLQLFYWKYTSGNWFSFNHTEGFDFFRPFTLKVLFSYKKGWLIYTPLMIFSIAGIYLLRKIQKNIFLPVLIFFLANLWFISSWECWWYAGSFGQRPFVQSYGLMAIPLGALLTYAFAKNVLNYFSIAFISFCVLLNQFQTWQVNHGILDLQLMTENYYWKIFGKTHTSPEWQNLLEIDRGNLPSIDDMKNIYWDKIVMKSNYENSHSTIDSLICDTMGFQSKKSLEMDSLHTFGANFREPFEFLTNKDYVRARFSADVFLPSTFSNKPVYAIFSMIGSRFQNYGYTGTKIDSTIATPGKWTRIHVDYVTPVILHSDDRLDFYIWDEGGERIFFDNVELEIYEEK